MIKITLDSAVYRAMVDSIYAVCTECRLLIDSTGITTRAVDSSNVHMIDFKLDRDAMLDLQCTEPTEIGVDIKKLHMATWLLKPNTYISRDCTVTLPVVIEIDTSNKKEIQISCEHTTYTLKLYDLSTLLKMPNTPQVDPTSTTFSISGDDLGDTIRVITKVSDKIEMSINNQTRELTIEGRNDEKTEHLTKKLRNEIYYTSDCNSVKSAFSSEYMLKMAPVWESAIRVAVTLGTEKPVVFDQHMLGGKCHIKYILAPRITPTP